MSDAQKDGGPAFPRAPLGEDCNKPWGHQDGMSLRDWFAGQAMAGIISSGTVGINSTYADLARVCYRQADAMLEARK